LQKLGYADEPDYFYLKNLLQQIYDREGYTDDMSFDWNTQQISAASPIPQISQSSMVDDPPIMSTYARGTASMSNNPGDGGLSSSVKVSNASSSANREFAANDIRNQEPQRPTRHSLPQQYVRETGADQEKKGTKRRKKVHCKPCSIM
jgi:hypothetical protein